MYVNVMKCLKERVVCVCVCVACVCVCVCVLHVCVCVCVGELPLSVPPNAVNPTLVQKPASLLSSSLCPPTYHMGKFEDIYYN